MVKQQVNAQPNILLIGMMGSGKSTVGPRLAAQLGLGYIDLDKEIAIRLGRSITMVFEQQGEASFRLEESKCLAYFAQHSGQVIDCGGGVVLDAGNRTLLAAHNTIFLSATKATLLERLSNISDRPMLAANISIEQQIHDLLDQRNLLYKQCARTQIMTDGLKPDEVVAEICQVIAPDYPS